MALKFQEECIFVMRRRRSYGLYALASWIRLTSGWMEFCRKKKLEVGDQCVLEFILAKDNVSYVIEVQVLRGRSGARSVICGKA